MDGFGRLVLFRALIVFEGVEQPFFLRVVFQFAFDALPFAVRGFVRVVVADDAAARAATDGA